MVEFALLMGSAMNGTVPAHSDLDLAIFLRPRSDKFKTLGMAAGACNDFLPGVRADIGVLNGAEPVYRFEAMTSRRVGSNG